MDTPPGISISRPLVIVVQSGVTNFVVTPVVALVRPGFTLTLDEFEVAEAFEVPLPYLMNPAHHQRHVFSFAGGQRQFLSMPWHGAGADGEAGEPAAERRVELERPLGHRLGAEGGGAEHLGEGGHVEEVAPPPEDHERPHAGQVLEGKRSEPRSAACNDKRCGRSTSAPTG